MMDVMPIIQWSSFRLLCHLGLQVALLGLDQATVQDPMGNRLV